MAPINKTGALLKNQWVPLTLSERTTLSGFTLAALCFQSGCEHRWETFHSPTLWGLSGKVESVIQADVIVISEIPGLVTLPCGLLFASAILTLSLPPSLPTHLTPPTGSMSHFLSSCHYASPFGRARADVREHRNRTWPWRQTEDWEGATTLQQGAWALEHCRLRIFFFFRI